MSFSRVELVNRLIREPAANAEEAANPNDADDELMRRRLWSDLNSFVADHLAEVTNKLEKIEAEIWGKLVVMERNFRTAKAYLRAPTVTIDGSRTYFDGQRLGLNQFQNEQRDAGTAAALRKFGKGIRIKCDKKGDIWLKKNGESEEPICVQCAQYPEPIFLTAEYQRIVNLRSFRDSLLHELEVRSTVSRSKLFRKAIIFVKLTDADPEKNPLECAVWLTIIHLVSVDMINALVNEQNETPVQDQHSGPESPVDSNEQPSSSSSQCESPFLAPPKLPKRPSFLSTNYAGDSTAEDSSASTSSYVPSSSSYVTKQSSTKSNSGVARRIFNQHPQRSQSVRRERPSRSRRSPTFRSNRLHFEPNGHSRPPAHSNGEQQNGDFRATQRKRSQSQPRAAPNGWSLLNLTDIDRMSRPLYFSSSEEAARGRRKRGGAGHQFSSSQTNLLDRQKAQNANEEDEEDLPPPLEPHAHRSRRSFSARHRWMSETSLRNVA